LLVVVWKGYVASGWLIYLNFMMMHGTANIKSTTSVRLVLWKMQKYDIEARRKETSYV